MEVFVEAFDGPNGNGNLIASKLVDIWYNGSAAVQDVASPAVEVTQLNLRVRDSYLPGTPILVRVEALDADGNIQRDLWDPEVRLTVDNPNVMPSTETV